MLTIIIKGKGNKAFLCPEATQDLELNTKNRDSSIQEPHIQYGPLNVDEPGSFWKDIAEHWNTSEDAAKKSLCSNCVAFDISPRMKDCMPGETSDDDGELGYCWMHHFKCHSARSCRTWAKGGPIRDDETSHDWQEKNKQQLDEKKKKQQKGSKTARKSAKRKKKAKKAKKAAGDRCTRIAKRKYDVWPCVPLKSEALTKDGWKTHEQISQGDIILAYDRISDTLKWTEVLNKHFFDSARVVSFEKQFHKIESTPNHKWVAISSHYKDLFTSDLRQERLIEAREVYDSILNNSHEGASLHMRKTHKGKSFLEFLNDSRSHANIALKLVETRDLGVTNSILTAAKLDESYPDLDFETIGKYSDDWIRRILSMSYRQVQAFFTSAIIYDGNQSRDLNLVERKRRSFNSYSFKQKDRVHGDIFELAAFLSGYNVYRGKRNEDTGITNFGVRENRFCSLNVMKKVEQDTQPVWCPETELGTWVMRQNGRIMITGNSAYASGAVVRCRRGEIWKGEK